MNEWMDGWMDGWMSVPKREEVYAVVFSSVYIKPMHFAIVGTKTWIICVSIHFPSRLPFKGKIVGTLGRVPGRSCFLNIRPYCPMQTIYSRYMVLFIFHSYPAAPWDWYLLPTFVVFFLFRWEPFSDIVP